MESPTNEEREEGEILDDDFEDISDNSIILPFNPGKSVKNNDHLRALSLSSISDEDCRTKDKRVRRKLTTTRRRSKHQRKKKPTCRDPHKTDTDSDDAGFTPLDKQLQKQLQKAIHVEKEPACHNSLEARLKAMTQPQDFLSTPLPDSLEESKDCDISTKTTPEKDKDDDELIQLRVEALHSVVINKYAHKKKRKAKDDLDKADVCDEQSNKSETNKENSNNINMKINNVANLKKPCLSLTDQLSEIKNEANSNVSLTNTTEEDEDVLRALLLASMSKKMTKDNVGSGLEIVNKKLTSSEKLVVPLLVKNINPLQSVKNTGTSLNNKVIQNVKNPKITLPPIKPLIINVNSDSDSDELTILEPPIINNKNVTNTVPVKIDSIQNSVEKFLKEQRAKVEAESCSTPNNNNNNNNKKIIEKRLGEKSAVKLLPKNKQIEYQKLLQKLKSAEKKPRLRRASQRVVESKINSIKKVPKNRSIVTKNASLRKIESRPQEKSETTNLLKSYKDIHVQKNGRLQIQERYKTLLPIVKKIRESHAERNKIDLRIKQLLQELSEAKVRMAQCSQDYTFCLKELSTKKGIIDSSLSRQNMAKFTSTPIREIKSTTLLKPRKLSNEQIAPQKIESIEVTFNIPSPPPAPIISGIDNGFMHIGDPNDVDKLMKRNDLHNPAIPQYISPLDYKHSPNFDPLAIICPFEVNGVCRDPECSYKHLVSA